jgi:hypothetical protein
MLALADYFWMICKVWILITSSGYCYDFYHSIKNPFNPQNSKITKIVEQSVVGGTLLYIVGSVIDY